ncbi:universal stress protein [Desulfosporosinus sp. FKB]|uniref:universal stress protein n=1 Tax=Desulfosporosinus sp. FKB TaxID=1969835 RepID=UPI001482051D|nr:universal stress protein [Desulfosporosinus sp. FKB]
MLNKILVPTDSSEYSRRALIQALELARKFNAEVELLFVMHDPYVYNSRVSSYVFPPELVEKEGEFVLQATLEGIDLSDINLTKKIKVGIKPGKVILDEIDNEKIDFVVMGSHGYGAIAGSMLGSVSQFVLHGAKCSVLIAK